MNGEHKPLARRVVEGVAVFGLLLGVAWWMFGRTLDVRPLGGDNLYVLSWVHRAPAAELVRLDPIIYPEWRPLAFATVWLQYRWQRLDYLAPYHAFNIVLWTACVWLVYQIVVRITSSRVAALIVAGLVLTDVRAITAQTLIIERQTTLAALFGLSAIWLVLRDRGTPWPAWKIATVGVLCLAGALSKEYGLAFPAGIAAYALLERRRDWFWAAASGVAVYAIGRWVFAGGATALYCEYMGYFFEVRKVCYDGVTTTSAAQMSYNVVATGVGTILPGVLTPVGQLAIAPMRLAVSAGLLAIGVVGWLRGPKQLRLALLVALGNTVLNFMVYGGRNQLMAVCTLGMVLGVGLATIDRMLRARSLGVARAAGVALLGAIICVQAQRTRVEAAQQVADLLGQDPCLEIARTEQHDPAFIRLVKRTYGMSDPDCASPR